MASKKTPIYILHGWTKDSSKWQPFIKSLKKEGFKVKLLKIPGLTAPQKKAWNLDNYVNWLQEKTKDDTKVILLAHSFGGRIAIRYEIKNPNKVAKLILIDSAGIRPSGIAARVKRAGFYAIAKIGKRITKNPGARQLLYKVAGEQDYHKADKILAKTMANIIAEDQRDEIGFVKSHTLIIWGRDDKTTPLSDGRFMNKNITGSIMRIIDEAGHSPQYSHGRAVLGHIKHFLKNSK